MSKENMPAADAAHYELAFHVLPTVAEGEVAEVVTALAALVAAAGGTVTGQEDPKRFDLAYEIVKYLEGRNRKFTSAYFGWIRFTLEPVKLAEIMETVEANGKLLRHLLIRLNKLEDANPFMFHEALTEEQAATEADDEGNDDEEADDADIEADDSKDGEDEVK